MILVQFVYVFFYTHNDKISLKIMVKFLLFFLYSQLIIWYKMNLIGIKNVLIVNINHVISQVNIFLLKLILFYIKKYIKSSIDINKKNKILKFSHTLKIYFLVMPFFMLHFSPIYDWWKVWNLVKPIYSPFFHMFLP